MIIGGINLNIDVVYCMVCEELIEDYDGSHVPVCDDCVEIYLNDKALVQD